MRRQAAAVLRGGHAAAHALVGKGLGRLCSSHPLQFIVAGPSKELLLLMKCVPITVHESR